METPSLVLREFALSDARDALRLSREDALRTWIPDQVYRDETEAADVLRFLIAQYDAASPRLSPYVLAACLRGSGELVGHVGFSPLGPDVEIGYAIAEKHQRRGLAAECVGAAVRWAIGRFALASVVGVAGAGNVASCKVLERSGFGLESEREGTLHGRVQRVRRYRYPPGSRAAGADAT